MTDRKGTETSVHYKKPSLPSPDSQKELRHKIRECELAWRAQRGICGVGKPGQEFQQSWFLFLTEETNICHLYYGLNHRMTLGKSLHLCASVSSSAKWGQCVIYLPQMGGMRIQQIKIQMFAWVARRVQHQSPGLAAARQVH